MIVRKNALLCLWPIQILLLEPIHRSVHRHVSMERPYAIVVRCLPHSCSAWTVGAGHFIHAFDSRGLISWKYLYPPLPLPLDGSRCDQFLFWHISVHLPFLLQLCVYG